MTKSTTEVKAYMTPAITKVQVVGKTAPNTKHAFVRVTVSGLIEEKPEVELSAGALGFSKIIGITPQPIDQHFGVVWNGDVYNPKLLFDCWVGDSVDVILDVWGS